MCVQFCSNLNVLSRSVQTCVSSSVQTWMSFPGLFKRVFPVLVKLECPFQVCSNVCFQFWSNLNVLSRSVQTCVSNSGQKRVSKLRCNELDISSQFGEVCFSMIWLSLLVDRAFIIKNLSYCMVVIFVAGYVDLCELHTLIQSHLQLSTSVDIKK